MLTDAYISEDGIYRYNLVRDWGDDQDLAMLFVMLNPSTADAVVDDPTIRRCIGFAEREGCGYMEVVNLFAFRATEPADMKVASDPIGPENNAVIRAALTDADIVVCAWGAHGGFLDRDTEVIDIILSSGHTPYALGLTKDGKPRHPLYLKKDAPLVEVPV